MKIWRFPLSQYFMKPYLIDQPQLFGMILPLFFQWLFHEFAFLQILILQFDLSKFLFDLTSNFVVGEKRASEMIIFSSWKITSSLVIALLFRILFVLSSFHLLLFLRFSIENNRRTVIHSFPAQNHQHYHTFDLLLVSIRYFRNSAILLSAL